MNNDDNSRVAGATGTKMVAAKALLARLRQDCAFELAMPARCDRFKAIRACLDDRAALDPDILNELAWRYCEALLAVATVASGSEDQLQRKLEAVSVIDGDWLASIDATLVSIAALSALCDDARNIGAPLKLEMSETPQKRGPNSVN